MARPPQIVLAIHCSSSCTNGAPRWRTVRCFGRLGTCLIGTCLQHPDASRWPEVKRVAARKPQLRFVRIHDITPGATRRPHPADVRASQESEHPRYQLVGKRWNRPAMRFRWARIFRLRSVRHALEHAVQVDCGGYTLRSHDTAAN